MAKNDNDRLQINVDFTKTPELLRDLDNIVSQDPETDRSKFIRNLIRQEIARRQQLALSFPAPSTTNKKSKSTSAQAVAG